MPDEMFYVTKYEYLRTKNGIITEQILINPAKLDTLLVGFPVHLISEPIMEISKEKYERELIKLI